MDFRARTGTLDVSCSAYNEAVTVVWTERGGSKVRKPTGPGGYGSMLVERSVTGHLRGSIDYDWAEEGVVVTLKVKPERLGASGDDICSLERPPPDHMNRHTDR